MRSARVRPLSFLASAAVVSAAALLTSACGGGSGAPGADASPPATFANSYLSFRHPAAWTAYPFRWSGELHFHPMLYLSTQPVRDPCHTQQTATVCAWPVGRLQPGGVLVTMENRGFPGLSLSRFDGASLRVGGRAAKRSVTRPGACAAIGGDVTIDVVVASPQPSNVTEFTACLRGPGLTPNEQRVDSLLASTRFLQKTS